MSNFPRHKYKLHFAAVLGVFVMGFGWIAGTTQAQTTNTTTGATSVGSTVRGIITQVDQQTVDGQPQVTYHLRLTSGPDKGKTVISGGDGGAVIVNGVIYHRGDHVLVATLQKFDGTTGYIVQDANRLNSLWILGVAFFLFIVWFSRWHGFRSLLGLAFSFVVIISWAVPQISHGANPVMIALVTAAAVLIVGFVITEGFSRLAWASIVGTVVTMVIIGLLSWWSIHFSSLTGAGSEESLYLQNSTGNPIDVRGLLLAGIIIGTLGILEDVAVSQVATIAELRVANPRMKRGELYRAGMRVGRTHLGAIINTLTLAYAGSALPLLLLFHLSGQPASVTINSEIVASEIVRSIIGSIGLVLALPITTWAAVLMNVRGAHGHGHAHTHTLPEHPAE